MEKDLLKSEEMLHYYVEDEDEDEIDLEGGAKPKNTIEISNFLKLLQKQCKPLELYMNL